MRVAFIGCVQFSEEILRTLIEGRIEIVGVVTKTRSAFNADFADLTPLAEANRIPVHHQQGADASGLGAWLSARAPDLVICVGWPNLLPTDVLTAAPDGVIGYHPTYLPKNRGRHPIIWALALGLEETASTFFRMDEGADSGPIASQVQVSIGPDDDAATLYARLLYVAKRQIVEVVNGFAAGTLTLQPQNEAASNSWRKRSKIDGRVDWRMPAASIHNLVRALAPPYPGAYCALRDGETVREVPLRRARVVPCIERNLEPGKVLGVSDGAVRVKAGVDAIELMDHGFDPLPKVGDYL